MLCRVAAIHAGLGHQLSNYTVHVTEAGMVENEVTFEMARLQRNLVQAGLVQ